MVWPVRTKDRPTINAARGFGPTGRVVRDRIDLTLECIRRHYEGVDNPLALVLASYGDFFALFDGFAEFIEFFHFQDLVQPDWSGVRSLMRPDWIVSQSDFEREATPATVQEYVSSPRPPWTSSSGAANGWLTGSRVTIRKSRCAADSG